MLKRVCLPGACTPTPEIAIVNLVMAGHSRPKDGVLSPAYVPAIHVFACFKYPEKAWMPGMKPGMTAERQYVSIVMAGHSRPKGRRAVARLCPGHPRLPCAGPKTWMPATSAGMTEVQK